jgi:hypothetical protein
MLRRVKTPSLRYNWSCRTPTGNHDTESRVLDRHSLCLEFLQDISNFDTVSDVSDEMFRNITSNSGIGILKAPTDITITNILGREVRLERIAIGGSE